MGRAMCDEQAETILVNLNLRDERDGYRTAAELLQAELIRVTVLTLHCNVCGARFAADEPRRRVCGRACRARLLAMRPSPQHASRQDEVLRALRASAGVWIAGAVLARRVYGTDDRAALQAFRATLGRLLCRPDLVGLVVDIRASAVTRHGHGQREYRLTRDVTDPPTWRPAS